MSCQLHPPLESRNKGRLPLVRTSWESRTMARTCRVRRVDHTLTQSSLPRKGKCPGELCGMQPNQITDALPLTMPESGWPFSGRKIATCAHSLKSSR